MFDPHSRSDISRLNEAVRESHRKLDRYRRQRRELIRELTGSYFSDGPSCPMPLNLMAQMIDIYLMHLAGRNPQVILPTAQRSLMPFLADLEAVVNDELSTMGFDKIVRRWVQEALLGMGVLKCGLVDGEAIEIIPGEPQPTQDYFVDVVDFDDFTFDIAARTWDQVSFIADRYQVDYDAARRNPEYAGSGLDSLKPDEEDTAAETGERTSSLSGFEPASDANDGGFRRRAWVWNICLPEEGLIITLPQNSSVTHPLKVVEWDGVQSSPYHILSFFDIPGNLIPLPPGQIVRSLNKSANALYRKLVRQAERQKTIGLFRKGQNDDVKSIQKAKDGDLVGVEHPDVINEVSFGGPNAESHALLLYLEDNFKKLSGNIDALGGLGPQSETAKQDSMIASSAGQKIAKMEGAVTDATVGVIRDLLYRIWNDPVRTYTSSRSVGQTGIDVAVTLPPDRRQGSFFDFDPQIQPYSMQYVSPKERSAELMQIMTQIVFPAMPFLQQQGIGMNLQRFFEYLSKYMSLPELQHILEFVGPPMPGAGADKAPQTQTSHRTYERISRPGATSAGNSATMQQMLMGGNPQPSQVEALGRPTGV